MKKSQAKTAAIAAGHATYVPEQPCRRGHLLRNIYGVCVECRRAQEKARYKKDPLATKMLVAKKYNRNAEKIKEKRRIAYAINREKEKAVAKVRSAEWRKNNPAHEGTKIAKQKWKLNNVGRVRADTIKRRLSKLQRTPAWLTEEDHWIIEQAYELAQIRTKMFGFSWHVDHILPLQGKFVSGLHVPSNLQVIPGIENVNKANRYLPA